MKRMKLSYRVLSVLFCLPFALNEIAAQSTVQVTDVSPEMSASNVPSTENIAAAFDETMDAASSDRFIVHGNFTGNRTGSYFGGGSTALGFDADLGFMAGEVMEISLTGDLVSENGHLLSPPFVWQFRTATSISPAEFDHKVFEIQESAGFTSTTFGDIDNDGDLDLIVAGDPGPSNADKAIFKNNGSGEFVYSGTFSLDGQRVMDADLRDMDNDGDLDLLLATGWSGIFPGRNQVLENDGTGHFLPPIELSSVPSANKAIEAGDLNGDGLQDIVTASETGGTKIWLNGGNLTFSLAQTVGVTGARSFDVELLDWDNDGDLDLAAGYYQGDNILFLNDGSGQFGSPTFFGGSPTQLTSDLEVGDFNGDGWLDLAESNILGHGVYVFLNQQGVLPATPIRVLGLGRALHLDVGDMDGDGDLDLVVGNHESIGSQNLIQLNDGTGHFTARPFGPPNDGSSVAVGDVDGDGDLDIAVASGNLNGHPIRVLFNQSDILPPVIECPIESLVVECAESGGAVVTFDLPGVLDDQDPNPSIVCIPASGSHFPVGDTVVTCTATDSSGNASSCSFTISVHEDIQAPTILLRQDSQNLLLGETDSACIYPNSVPELFDVVLVDDCGEAHVTDITYTCHKLTKKGKRIDKGESCVVALAQDSAVILDSGGVGDIITLFVTAEDVSGNTSHASFEVKVLNPGKGNRR